MEGILLDTDNDIVIDVQKDSSGLITSGLTIGNIDLQRCNLVVNCQKGELKEVPSWGFGIDNYLKAGAEKKQQFINELTKELKNEGFENPKVKVGKTLLDFSVEIN